MGASTSPSVKAASTPAKGSPPSAPRLWPKGSGGIFFIRDGVWRVDIEVSRDKLTGRRRRVSRQIEGTRKDAEAALARLKVASEQNRLPAGGTSAKSVRAAFDLYLAAVEAGTIALAPRTLLTSRSASNTMSRTVLLDGRSFGAVQLHRLTWKEIEELFGILSGNGASVAWVRRCATVLSNSLNLARKRGLIDSNPSKDVDRPKLVRAKPVSPTYDEVVVLAAKTREQDPEFADAVVVLASTGMRKAEYLALQWANVDVRGGELHVDSALTDAGPGKGVIRKSTKRSDWRDVPLNAGATAALQRQFERLTERWGRVPQPADYVFPNLRDPQLPYRPDSFGDRWDTLRGSSPVTLLQFRHYAATKMLDAGESYRTVADILGNSENTLRLHYDGRTDVGKRRAITALEL